MTENQTSMIEKIKIMERWIAEHLKDDVKIRMNAKERIEYINRISNVSRAENNAKAILKYMQRGQVFDMPEEIKEALK